MTTSTTDAEAYAAQVRAALADLPAADRDALLADLGDHLAEVADEDRDRPLADLLGPPAAYAAELRASAGLPAAGGDRAGPGRPARGWRDLPFVAATRAFLPELRPGWWVARALAVATLAAVVTGGGPLLGLVLAVVLVPASVALGRWTADSWSRRWLGIGFNLVAALVLLTVLGLSTSTSTSGGSVEVGPAGPGSGLEGVTNLFPYDERGRPLTGVRLYDQDGNPVELSGGLDPEGNLITRVPRYTTDGRVAGNVYPQEQTVETYPTRPPGATSVRVVPSPAVTPPALAPR